MEDSVCKERLHIKSGHRSQSNISTTSEVDSAVYNTIGCGANWYASTPSAISQTVPCDLISLSIIVTDVDGPRPVSGSVITDHTTSNG